jgi:hypothetical protein
VYDSVGAQMCRDGIIVDGADHRGLFGHSFPNAPSCRIFPSSRARALR